MTSCYDADHSRDQEAFWPLTHDCVFFSRILIIMRWMSMETQWCTRPCTPGADIRTCWKSRGLLLATRRRTSSFLEVNSAPACNTFFALCLQAPAGIIRQLNVRHTRLASCFRCGGHFAVWDWTARGWKAADVNATYHTQTKKDAGRHAAHSQKAHLGSPRTHTSRATCCLLRKLTNTAGRITFSLNHLFVIPPSYMSALDSPSPSHFSHVCSPHQHYSPPLRPP